MMGEASVTVDHHARPKPFVGAGRRRPGFFASLVVVAGAALLVVSAIIHLHLWASGYRNIRTIGPLFLVQGVLGIILGVSVALIRRVFIAVLGALFALGTLGGLLWSVHFGLFNYRENMAAPWATSSLVIEAVAAGVLLLGGALVLHRERATIRR
jgi:hypothetical protein